MGVSPCRVRFALSWAFRLVVGHAMLDDSETASVATSGAISEDQLPVDPAILSDDTLLHKLANENVERLLALSSRPIAPSMELMWASVNPGSEVALFVLDAIQQSYAQRGIQLRFKHAFSCEVNHDWISGVFHEIGAVKGCVFERAEHLAEGHATCLTHGRQCIVPHADIIIAGASCRDFSRASSSSHTGGSLTMFHGLVRYLTNHNVSLLFLENADSLDDAGNNLQGHVENLDVALRAVRKAGLVPTVFLLDSQSFGLPTARRRYYVCACKEVAPPYYSFASTSFKEMHASLSTGLAACQRKPPCATSLLLDDDNLAIEVTLNKRLSAGPQDSEYNVGAIIGQFQSEGLRWGTVSVAAETAESAWYATLTHSQKNVLTFSQAQRPNEVLCRDISQSCSNVRHSTFQDGLHIMFCPMPGQVVWLEAPGKQQRLFLGRETLLFQGYPLDNIQGLTDKTSEAIMQTMGSSAMPSVVLLAMVQSALFALPWRDVYDHPSSFTSNSDVDFAMSTFESLFSGGSADDTVEQAKTKKRKTISGRK